jgi:hypothetical protein
MRRYERLTQQPMRRWRAELGVEDKKNGRGFGDVRLRSSLFGDYGRRLLEAAKA